MSDEKNIVLSEGENYKLFFDKESPSPDIDTISLSVHKRDGFYLRVQINQDDMDKISSDWIIYRRFKEVEENENLHSNSETS